MKRMRSLSLNTVSVSLSLPLQECFTRGKLRFQELSVAGGRENVTETLIGSDCSAPPSIDTFALLTGSRCSKGRDLPVLTCRRDFLIARFKVSSERKADGVKTEEKRDRTSGRGPLWTQPPCFPAVWSACWLSPSCTPPRWPSSGDSPQVQSLRRVPPRPGGPPSPAAAELLPANCC